jgi:F-type H+-transporting ATPase subunit epsilon
MADKLHFDLVSPERRLFRGEVDMVVVPGEEGDFGVLPGHAPVMSAIRSGAISVHSGDEIKRTFIHGGFAEVTPEGLTVLAEEAIDLASVNAEQLAKDLAEAREDIGLARDEHERHIAEDKVAKFEALTEALKA